MFNGTRINLLRYERGVCPSKKSRGIPHIQKPELINLGFPFRGKLSITNPLGRFHGIFLPRASKTEAGPGSAGPESL